MADLDGAPPRILARPDHPVSRQLVDHNAVKVLYRLHNHGYKAYLVGGGVRDLMLGRQPKDFDISTDAQPNELRRLFRNARIIGRRFRLAHIIFREGIVEVATFRRTPDPSEQRGGPEDRLITNDNTFGSPREDAFRRDFTVNALFYNIADFSVIDYVGGIEDLESKLIRVIGEPTVRFEEDPVRMLRACEFAGRLGFTIERRTQEGIYESRKELSRAAPPRLTEELLQLLKSGHASASVQWMLELGVLHVLLPEALAMLSGGDSVGDFSGILPTLDRLARSGRELSDVQMLGAVLLPELLARRYRKEMSTKRWMKPPAFAALVEGVLESFGQRFALPNVKRLGLIHALEGFHRMCGQTWGRPQRQRFAAKSFFDDALVLFEVLVRATGDGSEDLERWQAAARQRPARASRPSRPRRRRRRRRRRR